MKPIVMRPDFGDDFDRARKHASSNPQITLKEFLGVFPARFLANEAPTEEDLKLPVSAFLFVPVTLKESESVTLSGGGGAVRGLLDALHEEESDRNSRRAQRKPEEYPEKIEDVEAVRIAYRHEMDAIANFLNNDLSVLVVCDKILTGHIYEFVCNQAGRKVVLDNTQSEENNQGMAGRLDQAMQGRPSEASPKLRELIHGLKPREVLVLRSLDLLDQPPLIELVYQNTDKGQKPQLLAFLDPSLEVKKVLTDRFAVHVAIMGLPRFISLDGKTSEHTVTRLLTRDEHARFAKYEPEGLYKNVSGLNAVQFRNAMKYVAATVAENSDPTGIYRVIRQFKRSSSDEIEIPDTNFDDIGGYESVKQQLRRIISLIAGPIEGMSEKQRGQLIPRGFIFHGPPGTGKTLFAKAIANEMNATIQMISGPEIMDKYVGQSENNLRRIFATARRNAPAVVFFDEFDSIASQRSTYSDGGARANNAVVAQFLTEMDGFRQDQAVLVIGTTNRIDIIDEALLRPSRLRPIEIPLPDYAARRSVAAIHASSFGVDKLLKNLFTLANENFDHWSGGGRGEKDGKKEGEKNGNDNGARLIPEKFLESLFNAHPPHKKRYDLEERQAGFLRDVQGFFDFVLDCRWKESENARTPVLDQLNDRLVKLGERYGLDFSHDTPPRPQGEEAEPLMTLMRADLCDLFIILLQQRSRRQELTAEAFLGSLMDLVAEYTDNFNNDEIRAIFQEASLEHHLEGQLVTPRYLGQKIGVIRKRRDERLAVHISSQRGRR